MKICFITFGCKLNQSESFSWQDKLSGKKIQVVTEQQNPDLIIVNACSVTLKAERELRQKVNQLKRKFPRAELILTGCFLFPPKIVRVLSRDKMASFIDKLAKQYLTTGEKYKSLCRTRTFIKIQDGCNNFCAYCIVPYLRGRIYSRSISEIINEIRKRETQGCQEIVLVGTDLQKFKDRNNNLIDLLNKILSETKINRIRISSLWPTAIKQRLINLMKNNSRICPHLHLSMQSGSNEILKVMGRPYQASQILNLIKQAKKIKNLSLTADLIVGFPGETKKDFLKTVNFVKKAGLLKVHVFKYSPRPGTKAAKMTNQVLDAIKTARSQELKEVSDLISKKFKNKYISKVMRVLFEAKRDGYWSGFTDNYLRVYVPSRVQLTNQFVEVKLTSLFKDGYRAKVVK
ncbi:MAG: MiaB/RimO family radical SAM methylthiotransferase [Patescibacteria group bacterium]|nr:MiaB/RimO family radical SAM methylthiotransferase [Patescibacteria group bacterium]MDD5121637.1 MiaB/RimO family radical SAM methylthiotransferase [Patescibacteria group bacterium]MDD5221909.1 MiaB/RimO family radical SAM methylthiotransferase [Patescibacteria group bacterium]MDD5396199.1 MiaB/RimO family radical SAM methylthiotransferase [Patescibacteria group bacterium]